MSLILAIETATPVCSVALLTGGRILGLKETREKNSHAAVVTVFIDELLREQGLEPSDLDAVAVSKGPGSYTGLRIGVSTAKGLCYALDIPLISVGTLESMSAGMRSLLPGDEGMPVLLAPMIDARRMEVYTALFDPEGHHAKEVTAEIVTAESFSQYRENHLIYIAGDGAEKCREVLNHPNIRYMDGFEASAVHMAAPATTKFAEGIFENTAYFEPYYLKDFIAGAPKVKGLRD
ncbi:MAG TPA: tRNA (adenosine(37)-N6)-threonylcarbamoyltransferase complex dimerization subunit type 1 TsaB [Lentimicrobium sp.]|nr:tRNA (adenosine(37)-N6)-threonylcarbamoyltransferase complex dimerization subunit type 1 TsaB [Lentimicrobium sp.]